MMQLTIRRVFLVQMLLTAVFVLSFLPYVFGLTLTHLLIPVAFLSFVAALLPLINPQRFGLAVSSLRSSPFLWLAVIMPIFPFAWAVLHQETRSELYMLLMLVVLASCRLILTVIGFRAVLRAFGVAGLICIAIFVVNSLGGLMHAAQHAVRFRPRETQPNTVAFIFGGFTVAWLSEIWGSRSLVRRFLYGAAVIIAGWAIFLASSRASMLAVTVAVISVACISMLRLRPTSAVPIKSVVIAGLACCALVFVPLAMGPTVLEQYIGRFLQIHSHYRGISSGLSGRVPRWAKTVSQVFKELHWVIGYGYDTSRTQLGFSIDNGYLTILYEAGVFGLSIILVRLASLLRWSFFGVYRFPELRGLLMVLVAFTLNNVFDRYLFRMGNPFSLLALFVLLLDRQDLREYEFVLQKTKSVPCGVNQAETFAAGMVSRVDSDGLVR